MYKYSAYLPPQNSVTTQKQSSDSDSKVAESWLVASHKSKFSLITSREKQVSHVETVLELEICIDIMSKCS